MSETVTPIGLGVHLSLSALSDEFGLTRETLRKRLAAADVKPAGEHRGNPLWRLRDVYQAIITGPDSPIDPAALPPFQRKAHYQAQLEEIRLRQQCGELVPAIEMEAEMARVCKAFTRFLDALPDVLERECGVSGPETATVEKHIDRLRNELAVHLIDAAEGETHVA